MSKRGALYENFKVEKLYIKLINSRTAIAGAIIGLLLVFYNSKSLNCIGALYFFKICSHILFIMILLWFLLCFQFFGSDFFPNGFLNPFNLYSRPSFWFEPNFHFSLVVFFTCGILKLIFCFFNFLSDFSEMDFPIHSVLFRSSFLFSQWKFIELYVRTCPAMFFYSVVKIFVTTIWGHSHFLFFRSCNFNWIACVTSFLALIGASFFHSRD